MAVSQPGGVFGSTCPSCNKLASHGLIFLGVTLLCIVCIALGPQRGHEHGRKQIIAKVWFGHIKEGVRQGQRLKVVYYPGMVGKGKVTMEDLKDPKVSLWDSDPAKRGLGGSQKAEVATLDAMRQKEGDAWEYDEVDAADFLKDSFSPGQTVAAWHEDEWKRGMVVAVPDAKTAKKPADGLKWQVKCQRTGQRFTTDRVRHESAAMQKLADKLSENTFIQALNACLINYLPDGQELTKPREEKLRHGTPAMTFDLQIEDVEALKKLCAAVLSGDLELAINTATFKHDSYSTNLCKSRRLSLSRLTKTF